MNKCVNNSWMLKLKLHSIVMYMYPLSRLIKYRDHWISYIELNFIVFFHQVENWFPLLKTANLLDYFYSLLKQTLYSIYVPLLIYKIDHSHNKYFTKSCVIIEQCWSTVTSVCFVTVQVYIRDCTMVNMYPLLLFGGGSISVDLEKGNFVLTIDDGWIRFLADSTKVYLCCCISSTTCEWMPLFSFLTCPTTRWLLLSINITHFLVLF